MHVKYDNGDGVIYTRFSSQSQDKQTTDVQLKACRDYADRENINIVAEFSDEAYTGRNFERPDYHRMLTYLDKHPNVKYVIVYKYDRFARNTRLQLNEEYELQKRGIIPLSTIEPYSNDANGIMMRQMNYIIAEYYSNDYSQRIKKGLDNVASKCQSVGGQRSLGYRTENKQYVIVDNEAVAVRNIFERYARGDTEVSIINYLNELGLKTTRNNEFNKNSLHRLLRNKRYTGTYIYKDKEVPNAMPRIISDELFYKAQERIAKNKSAPSRSRAKNEYLLTTKLFCGNCKNMMVGSAGTSKTNRLYTYYICKGTLEKTCDTKRIPKEYLEDIIIDNVRKFLTDKNIDKIAQKVVKLYQEQQSMYVIKQLERAINKNNKAIDNYVTSVGETSDSAMRQKFYDKIALLEKENKGLQRELAIEKQKQLNITYDNIKFFLTELRNGDINDIKYRKSLINALVNKIYVYDDKLIVIINTQNESVEIDNDTLFSMEEVLIRNTMLHQIDRKLELFEFK